MLARKIPIVSLLPVVLGSSLITFWLSRNINQPNESSVDHSLIPSCSVDIVRLKGFEYTKPILFTERTCESEKFMPLKTDLSSMLDKFRQEGKIINGSVYFRQMNQAEWFGINADEKYNPGSLMKVPELIAYLKMSEKEPGLLNKRITWDKVYSVAKKANFTSKSIEFGKSYTIRELLYYMIAYSDNNATILLNNAMDLDVFKKVFTDLGLRDIDMSASDYPLSPKEFSLFMRTLYSATYLNMSASEFCTEMLSHSDFKMGLLAGLPEGVRVAHKFGEAGGADGSAHLGESGIVYLNNSPYLLTVMVKGKSQSQLPGVISEISKYIFTRVQGLS